MSRRGHIPYRLCLGCRSRRPQAALLRLTETYPGLWHIDRDRRLGGRGHYLCLSEACLNRALKQKAARGTLAAPTIQQIRQMIKGEQAEVEPTSFPQP